MKKGSFIGKFLLFFAVSVITIQQVRAQILPSFLEDLIGPDVLNILFNRVQVGFLILLGGFLALVVFYIIRGLMKFASKDTSDDLGEATKIMQRNLIAVGGVFIGVLGIAVVLIFFGINPTQILLHKSCIESPNGYGCFACKEKPSKSTNQDNFDAVCSFCDDNTDGELATGVLCSTEIPNNTEESEVEDIINNADVEKE